MISRFEVERHNRFAYSVLDVHPDDHRRVAFVAEGAGGSRGCTSVSASCWLSRSFCSVSLPRNLPRADLLPPYVSVWIPNFIYAFIAYYLYKKAPK